jgi:RNA polymerase sigma-B factor
MLPEAAMAEEKPVIERFRRYRESKDRALRNQLVEEHRWIAERCAWRFSGKGEPLDDLVQVGLLGVLKAVERFDPDRGSSFEAFAMPTVKGELRRHFRDTTWGVRVTRRVKDMQGDLRDATERLSQRLQRPPLVSELAAELRVGEEEILEAMEARAAYRSLPLVPPSSREAGEDDPVEDGHTMGRVDGALDQADDRMAVLSLLETLPERERTILYLRYFEELSQAEIAARVGTSQVHVSRLIRGSIALLRDRAGETTPA